MKGDDGDGNMLRAASSLSHLDREYTNSGANREQTDAGQSRWHVENELPVT